MRSNENLLRITARGIAALAVVMFSLAGASYAEAGLQTQVTRTTGIRVTATPTPSPSPSVRAIRPRPTPTPQTAGTGTATRPGRVERQTTGATSTGRPTTTTSGLPGTTSTGHPTTTSTGRPTTTSTGAGVRPKDRQPSGDGGLGIRAGVPNINADLSASKFRSGEFVAYEKKLPTTTSLFFKLTTQAKTPQKIVWQASTQPFARPRDGLDWKAPAGMIASGEVAPASSDTTVFPVDFQKFLGAATEKPRVIYVRAVAIDAGRLAARPSNDVQVSYSAGSGKVDLPHGSTPKKNPRIDSAVSVIAYKPPVRKGVGCYFILTKTPPAGELKYILAKIKATQPGAKFSLCESDYEYLKTFLTPAERTAVAFQDFLKVLKSGYNWLDGKYNYIENALVDGLVSIGISREYARKAINYYKAIYGLNPSYGDFDESLDHGKQAFAAYISNSSDVPEDAKSKITETFDEFVEEVRKQANGGADPNKFFRADPDHVPRPFYVLLRVKYSALDGAPANWTGGKKQIKVTVTSGRTVDKSTLNSSFSSGYQEWPPVVIGEKVTDLPDAKPGTAFDLPVYVDYSSLLTSDEYRWTQGYNSLEPGRVDAGGSAMTVIVSQKKSK